MNISIVAEPVFNIGPLTVTNSLLTSWIVVAFLIILAVKTSKSLKKIPSYGQGLIEFAIEALYNMTSGIAGHKAKMFFPFIATFFFYILISNWSGLIPGVGTLLIKRVEAISTAEQSELDVPGETTSPHMESIPLFRGPMADLNSTLALAIISVALIQFFGVKSLGLSYFKKFFQFKNPIMTFVGLLELMGEFTKVISFAFRLFGNIFAGEVLLIVISFLIPVIAPVPFYAMEFFFGFIQALVFAMLSLVFLNIATERAEH